jgi:hypothetical protein
MNVEIGTEAAQFPEKEYINGIFLAVQGQLDWKKDQCLMKQPDKEKGPVLDLKQDQCLI